MSDVGSAVIASDRLQEPFGRYTVDGVRPSQVWAIHDAGELGAALAEASKGRRAVIPHGAGIHVALGNPPARYDIALDLAPFAGVIEYEPDDLTIAVRAGTPLAEVQSLLAERRLFLPLDPPGADRCTVGGMLATALTGPLRHGYGTARDWVIGMRVVLADGTLAKSGGRVVKNVTGYDMHKLHIGALGTLGVITEVTFKLAPLPRVERTLGIAAPTATAVCALAAAAQRGGLPLMAAEALAPPAANALAGLHGWALVLRVAGGPNAVERAVREVHGLADRSDATTAHDIDVATFDAGWRAAFRPDGLAVRISVRPSHVGRVLEAVDRRLAGHGAQVAATVSAGVVRVVAASADEATAPHLLATLRDVTAHAGATIVIDAAPRGAKAGIDVFGEPRQDWEIMRRLKDEFDPVRILAPGRYLGRL
jgi:glycolate oxidase FAD binding subunit